MCEDVYITLDVCSIGLLFGYGGVRCKHLQQLNTVNYKVEYWKELRGKLGRPKMKCGKLSQCTSDKKMKGELFLVEGTG